VRRRLPRRPAELPRHHRHPRAGPRRARRRPRREPRPRHGPRRRGLAPAPRPGAGRHAMSFLVGVLVLVVGLVVSIALHEVGHLVPAKRFGVKVTEYFVGFGPTLWSRRRGETEYGVKAVPLGGYVRMVGMYPPA